MKYLPILIAFLILLISFQILYADYGNDPNDGNNSIKLNDGQIDKIAKMLLIGFVIFIFSMSLFVLYWGFLFLCASLSNWLGFTILINWEEFSIFSAFVVGCIILFFQGLKDFINGKK